MANKPNILFFLVDQMRMPPVQSNLTPRLKLLNQVLSFDPDMADDNPFIEFFPAFKRLRRHSVRLAHHHIASAACVPSRGALITGQYGCRTGVTQTAGMFKNDYDPDFPWLANNQVPTIGDWFRTAGYDTHYLGRHDFTTPPAPTLDEWGFSSWTTSWPSSQGAGFGNLGVFRDIGFVDVTVQFLNQVALGTQTNIRNVYNNTNATTEQKPFFAVSAFVNPHDITGWPLPWLGGIQVPPNLTAAKDAQDFMEKLMALLAEPAPIPGKNEPSNTPPGGTYSANLNPDGFPQDNGVIPENWCADLATKPTCQLDASFKISQGFLAQWPQQLQPAAPLPYKLTPRPYDWYTAHLQAYIYMTYLVNLELEKVLSTLDKNGLWNNTIVVFTSDHGEMGGAQGGQVEKWHNAYRETIHVPCIVSSPLVNPDKHCMRNLDFVSSHIDLAPTLLGLAGYGKSEQERLLPLILGHTPFPLVGRDLSALIKGDPGAQAPTGGVLFVTDDEITQPTSKANLPSTYVNYLEIVKRNIALGRQPAIEGPITQPNHIKAYCEREWKIAQYWDPNGVEADQWELYYLAEDPEENINLVSWRKGQPVPEPGRIPKGWKLKPAELDAALARMREGLTRILAHSGYGESAPAPKQNAFALHNWNAP